MSNTVKFEGNEYAIYGEGFQFRSEGTTDDWQEVSFDDAPQAVADGHAALAARRARISQFGFDPDDPEAGAPKIQITRADGSVEKYQFGQRSMTPDGLGPDNRN